MLEIVNMYAVLVAAIFAMVVASVWYSPLLFAKPWMQLRGQDPEKMETMGFPASKMIIEFASTLITAFVLALFSVNLPQTIYASIVFALIIWVGFYVTVLIAEVLWEDKPFGLFLINAGLRLVTLIGMILILVMWR